MMVKQLFYFLFKVRFSCGFVKANPITWVSELYVIYCDFLYSHANTVNVK
jgi:hypothetical protein